MSLPLKTRVFWALYKTFEFAPAMQQPADKVRKASDLRKKMLALGPSRPVVGGTNKGAFAVESSLTLDDGTELPLRIHRPTASPQGPLPVVVNFHGGGWVSGDVHQSEWWASSVAAEAKVVVVSVEYRLAPENPFPIPPEDCYAATRWTAGHAVELGIDPAKLAVMGDSAGGNLAAVVSMMARDRGGPAVALQVLLYPSVDLVGSYASEDENAHAPVLGKKDLDNVPRLYFHGVETEMSDPYASPLRGKHEGLPPAVIQTAQYDPLRDQGYAYADALRAAGVPVRHTNYVRAVHGYISLPGVVPAAHQALAEVVQVLGENFG
ncbi:alpha/beta hydrolase [Jatrophihabitans endophyticus]|uniref:alpha/beta hydrolase n=1 Tax=Jatrophihabitans endophyticus TaxID=1206085 RepID=UPI0019DA9796|nr:alpha/beta hydrolase [Jatrophihabitans endophyticus]MBE7188207.1 alpha/beta hydrolase [Jatrophihabitans endophyticus]